MKISQPFDDMPLWQFENIDIPELNYSKYRYISGQNMDFLTSDPIYSKRKRIEFTVLNQCEDFKQIKCK